MRGNLWEKKEGEEKEEGKRQIRDEGKEVVGKRLEREESGKGKRKYLGGEDRAEGTIDEGGKECKDRGNWEWI